MTPTQTSDCNRDARASFAGPTGSAIGARSGEPMKREEAVALGIADASAEVSSRALIAERNRLTGEASVAPCSVENEIAEAGSTGWLGGGTARCQSMEGMLHH